MRRFTPFGPTATKVRAVISSTNGYCQEIFLRQYRQRPRSIKKDRRGRLSLQESLCLHRGQRLLPCQNLGAFSSFNRQIKTFKKLPLQSPKRKRKASITIFIVKQKSRLVGRIFMFLLSQDVNSGSSKSQFCFHRLN